MYISDKFRFQIISFIQQLHFNLDAHLKHVTFALYNKHFLHITGIVECTTRKLCFNKVDKCKKNKEIISKLAKS